MEARVRKCLKCPPVCAGNLTCGTAVADKRWKHETASDRALQWRRPVRWTVERVATACLVDLYHATVVGSLRARLAARAWRVQRSHARVVEPVESCRDHLQRFQHGGTAIPERFHFVATGCTTGRGCPRI